MDEYFQILGIPPNATHTQIKKAYRKLALHYHPDINPTADAYEFFLKITEAYEVLTGAGKLNNPFKKYYYQKNDQHDFFRRQAARERAHRHAKMQYEEFCKNNEVFQKSWYYYPAQLLVMAIYFLGWIFGFFLMLTPLLAGYYIHMKGGYWWQGFLFLPLILAGPLIIHQSMRLKKEASPYFKDHLFII